MRSRLIFAIYERERETRERERERETRESKESVITYLAAGSCDRTACLVEGGTPHTPEGSLAGTNLIRSRFIH